MDARDEFEVLVEKNRVVRYCRRKHDSAEICIKYWEDRDYRVLRIIRKVLGNSLENSPENS